MIGVPDNRAPMPKGAFVAMSSSLNMPLSTNVATYAGTNKSVKRPSQFTIQVDCYGPGSGDRATAITTLLRDQYGCEEFRKAGYDMQPLYAGDAHQMPLVNGEAQYEERWTFDAVMQINPVLTMLQESAIVLKADLKNVDATSPP